MHSPKTGCLFSEQHVSSATRLSLNWTRGFVPPDYSRFTFSETFRFFSSVHYILSVTSHPFNRTFQMLHNYQPARKQRRCQVIAHASDYFIAHPFNRTFQMLHNYQPARKQRRCQVIATFMTISSPIHLIASGAQTPRGISVTKVIRATLKIIWGLKKRQDFLEALKLKFFGLCRIPISDYAEIRRCWERKRRVHAQ
jgi:hypothetical protein